MNIFTIFFLPNFSKIFSKTQQIAPFLKEILGGAYPRTPLINACFATRCMALAPCKHPYFYKNILNPRNEILDTPLHT